MARSTIPKSSPNWNVNSYQVAYQKNPIASVCIPKKFLNKWYEIASGWVPTDSSYSSYTPKQHFIYENDWTTLQCMRNRLLTNHKSDGILDLVSRLPIHSRLPLKIWIRAVQPMRPLFESGTCLLHRICTWRWVNNCTLDRIQTF